MGEKDLIYRQAAIDALEREKMFSTVYKDGYAQTDYFKQYNMGLTDGIKAINALPSAERKRGQWQLDPSGYGFWICSNCGFVSEASGANLLYHFCPNCGADMRERREE